MRYTVTWLPSAQNALASLWVQAGDKTAISAASNRIDRMLATVPLSLGTAHGRYRRFVLKPLEIAYSVSPPDRLVEVVHVALLP